MDDSCDSREFQRAPTRLDVELRSPGGDPIGSGTTRDLSLTGVFVECTCRLPVGASCQLTLRLGERGGDAPIEAGGRVLRVGPGGMAIRFSQIPLASYERLQLLVVDDSIDPEAVLKELRRRWRQDKA